MIGLTLARVIVSVMLLTAPFILFVAASRKQDNALLLIFPMFGAVPAIIGALVLFVPLEGALDQRGLAEHKNWAVPLAGAAIIFLFVVVMGTLSGKLGKMVGRLASGGLNAWGPLMVWSVLGALWGVVWRSTEWLAKTVGLAHG